jgi:DNA-binding CsgD family transcriptional regulator/PAS domain-containing protein
MAFAELVSSIYEAGVDPERWPLVVRALCEHFNARTMILFSTPVAPERFSFMAEHGADPEWEAIYNRHYTTGDVNPAAIAYRRLPVGQPSADWMIVPQEQFHRSPFYNDWALPQNYHHFAGMITELGPGKIGGFMFSRTQQQGAVDVNEIAFLSGLAPHLCRAVGMSRRIGAMEGRLRLYEALFDAATEAIVVIEADGYVIEANHRAQALLEASDGIVVRNGRLATLRPEHTEMLLSRVAALLGGDHSAVEPFALPRPAKVHPLVVSLAALPDDLAGSWARRPAAAVFIADPQAAPPDMVQGLMRVYNLTRAEAVLVDLIARDGPSLAEAAERLGVGRETVRTHLKRAFDKTGVRRQSDLTRLALQTVASLRQNNGRHV